MNRGIDPTQDVAGILGDECFLCGKRGCDTDFGPSDPMAPKLAAHSSCYHGRSVTSVAAEYNRRIHDLAGVARSN